MVWEVFPAGTTGDYYTYFSQAQVSLLPDYLDLDNFAQDRVVNGHFAYGQLSSLPASTSDSFILPS